MHGGLRRVSLGAVFGLAIHTCAAYRVVSAQVTIPRDWTVQAVRPAQVTSARRCAGDRCSSELTSAEGEASALCWERYGGPRSPSAQRCTADRWL